MPKIRQQAKQKKVEIEINRASDSAENTLYSLSKMSYTKWRGTALYACLIALLNLFRIIYDWVSFPSGQTKYKWHL